MYAKIELMRKFFAILLLGILFIPSVDAFVYRRQPSYSFRRAEINKSERFTRARWRPTTQRYSYRFHPVFKRTDYERWRSLETHLPEAVDGGPIEQSFCNFTGSIIGEYLPTAEATNRCCICFDGWKCEIPDTANLLRQHECDPDWAANQGFVENTED